MRIPVAAKFRPLLESARYKGAYGGRGGAKSHFFAEQVISRAYGQPLRVVCIREVQNSIRDSVRQLLVDKIQKFGWGHEFDVLDSEIRCKRTGALTIFKGMQSYNAENIKSLENYDVAWVEEAQTLSQKSLDLLRPTIRKDGSELWFSWNPRHRTDPVDVFFRKNPHPEAVGVFVNWRDNPWFPQELRKEMEFDKEVDPEKAEHIWEGAYGVDEGAILARFVDRAEREGRLNAVDFDSDGSDIEISSDIGFRDTAAWWFWQRKQGGYSLIDYDEDSGLDAEEWIERLQDRLTRREWPLGRIWLPHDARAKTFRSRRTVIQMFLEAFGKRKCAIVPRSSKSDRINAGRMVIRSCEFNESRCERGLDGLRAWIFKHDDEKQVFSREPEHNWASHPSDAFTYGCQVMQTQAVPESEEKRVRWPHEQTADEVFWPERDRAQKEEWV